MTEQIIEYQVNKVLDRVWVFKYGFKCESLKFWAIKTVLLAFVNEIFHSTTLTPIKLKYLNWLASKPAVKHSKRTATSKCCSYILKFRVIPWEYGGAHEMIRGMSTKASSVSSLVWSVRSMHKYYASFCEVVCTYSRRG